MSEAEAIEGTFQVAEFVGGDRAVQGATAGRKVPGTAAAIVHERWRRPASKYGRT
jgi:hypothetical protein